MAGTLIHGGQPGFLHTLNAVELCVESVDLTVNRNVVEARTNCGLTQVAGEVTSEISDAGPLGFGAASDEATKWAHMIATTTTAWTMKPQNTTTGVANPLYTGTVLGTQFKISMTPTGNITQSFGAKITNSTGYPVRTTA